MVKHFFLLFIVFNVIVNTARSEETLLEYLGLGDDLLIKVRIREKEAHFFERPDKELTEQVKLQFAGDDQSQDAKISRPPLQITQKFYRPSLVADEELWEKVNLPSVLFEQYDPSYLFQSFFEFIKLSLKPEYIPEDITQKIEGRRYYFGYSVPNEDKDSLEPACKAGISEEIALFDRNGERFLIERQYNWMMVVWIQMADDKISIESDEDLERFARSVIDKYLALPKGDTKESYSEKLQFRRTPGDPFYSCNLRSAHIAQETENAGLTHYMMLPWHKQIHFSTNGKTVRIAFPCKIKQDPLPPSRIHSQGQFTHDTFPRF